MSELDNTILEATLQLEQAWDIPDGVFFRLREGDYDPTGVEAVLKVLQSVAVDDGSVFPRRFVSLTWWIPTFMEWQRERVTERGGDVEALNRDVVRVRNTLDGLLGVP